MKWLFAYYDFYRKIQFEWDWGSSNGMGFPAVVFFFIIPVAIAQAIRVSIGLIGFPLDGPYPLSLEFVALHAAYFLFCFVARLLMRCGKKDR